MKSNIQLSIVIPTYNEEGNIVTLLEKTQAVLQAASITYELIIVDDNSKDRTRSLVKALMAKSPEIKLIERDHERGLASAMVRGYAAAQGMYLGAMDADLAHDPKELPRMLSLLERGEADFVIGSRYVPGARFEGKALVNKVASLVGQILIRVILGLRVKDTSNNYRLFRQTVWHKIRGQLHPTGNIMLTEIVYLAKKNGCMITELPIHYIERRAGKSKLSVYKETIQFFKNILKIKYQK